ncbi:MAG: hypothetical protein MJ192_05460 [Clostridia bacterium]|nr:hypothetical protein [Clostridia bacterium]
MKRTISLVLSLCLIVSFLILPASASINQYGREIIPASILTPMGTAVEVFHRTGELIASERAEEAATIAKYEARGATHLTSGDISFNCFAFAFVGRDINESNVWLNDPASFIDDGSFIEIDEPVVGCVVVYWDDCDITLRLQEEDGSITNVPFGEEVGYSHAGVVTDVKRGADGKISPSNVTVLSKWGLQGLFLHAADNCPYVDTSVVSREMLAILGYDNPDGTTTIYTLFRDHVYQGLKYYVPNPALYSGLTIKKDANTFKQGLYADADGELRFYVQDRAWQAGVVSDAAGNYYYIDESLKAVKNKTVTISLSHSNGLLPDGTYKTNAKGVIENLPVVIKGESIRDGVVLTPDGQIKTMKNGYPTEGLGVYKNGVDYYFAGDADTVFGKHTDGSVNYDIMLTDTSKAVMTADDMNGLLPFYAYTTDEEGMITNLPTKLDSQTTNFATGLMRLPDKKIVLYKNGVAQTNATTYTDPANGNKYNFRYGATTYSVVVATSTAKASARTVTRLR